MQNSLRDFKNASLAGLYGVCAVGLLTAMPAKAQVSLETQLDTGLWRFTFAVEKTTFVGQYGVYIEPAVAKEWKVFWHGPPPSSGSSGVASGSGGSAGKPSKPVKPVKSKRDFWKTLLPSGKLPSDLQLRYSGVSGEYASLMFEPEVVTLWAGLKPRVSVGAMYDKNALSGNAPSGFGILTDPTKGYASASISAVGIEVALPVWGFETGRGSFALYAGHGWMKDWTFTYGTVHSVFLQLSTKTYVHSVIQTYSLTGEWRPPNGAASLLDFGNIAKFSGVDVLIEGYGTEHMWTIGATASLIWRL